MFVSRVIASLSVYYLLIVYKVHMYFTSKKSDVLKMALWSLIFSENSCLGKGKLGREQLPKRVIKDLGRIPG
jgi:hypothetical protein